MATHRRDFDFIVLGSGIAGLNFALRVAGHGRVAVVTKKNRADSNTNWAQGGIASVTSPEDSFDLHIRDTLEAGAGLCREDVVRTVVEEGPARIRELLDLGARFSEREIPEVPGRRELDLTREGGHSKRRVLHAADATGAELERTYLRAVGGLPSVTFFEDHLAVDLITSAKLGLSGPNRVLGVYVFDRLRQQVEVFAAPVVVLATGGSGKVYLYTTNPDIATGDGVAMAYRAGLPVANLEFVQFHPTCLYHPQVRNFLITEAVRGEGAVLRGGDQRRFMDRYDPRAELAPRDIVARAIDSEMKRTGADCVFLDLTHLEADFIAGHFPTILSRCRELGIDITRQSIPVVPAAHYQCGGVVATVDGETEIGGLFAIGEVACTGLHGANRLASNSLLEALVCSHRAASRVLGVRLPSPGAVIPEWQVGSATDPDELVVVAHNWDEIRRAMWDYVGIVRTTKRLRRAETRLGNLSGEIREFYWNFRVTADLLELRNLATMAELIVACALRRPESRGLHYNLDFPGPDPAWATQDTRLRRGDPGAP
ncbi:MAG: L-aspartate oxidase [Limisphaerales bacterium]